MSKLLQSIDDRTRLAGTNRIEILLFSLGVDQISGREEVFGINVFKVREVMLVPEITRAPEMPDGIEGMVSLRGSTVPVINLIRYIGFGDECKPNIMMVTEYNTNIQGFLVSSVDTIERLAWEDIRSPPSLLDSQHGGLITAVTEMDDRGLVMIMDVEKVLVDVGGISQTESSFGNIPRIGDISRRVIFADDSSVAREQIKRTFEEMGVEYHATVNGLEAWNLLQEIAADAESRNQPVSEQIQLILTDIEMPEMDGYVLTQKVKGDDRFNDIPVVMHSSLSTQANEILGRSVGVDAYVPKFKPEELASTVLQLLSESREKPVLAADMAE
ncbi:MAG: chemotaxis protein CheV [Gammaproteobacteria bacterium]|nr:chemotaxis protein CheV [Gammaproteobacteria bacterium]